MNILEQDEIISLIKREVVPAIGCTEPIAVAFATARAAEILGCEPSMVELKLSANILKNAMGVGIPGTDMIGLPIAIALGALIGRSEYGLEVLRDLQPADVTRGKAFINDGKIDISLKQCSEKLYIEVLAKGENGESKVIIANGHTNIIFESLNGEVLLDSREPSLCDEEQQDIELDMRKVYDFAMETPLERLEFMEEAAHLNRKAAEISFTGHYGHNIGNIMESPYCANIFGTTPFTQIISYTSAACDARMAGAMVPVMSNSGSGNQGIAATVPVVIFAEKSGASREQLLRALTLSHLTAIYIKQSLGKLSALCGCVVAATGSSCAITYLMGGNYEQITSAVKNMVANLTGMICDGAKPSCSLKIASGVATAVLSAAMSMEGACVTSVEGIIDNDVDKCIENLTKIGREGMEQTDHLVLDIMTSK